MTTMQQIVVAAFTERSMAEQAINDLLNAGFSRDQIRYGGYGTSTGGILDTLKSLFTGQGTAGDLHDDLLDMGVPEDDAHYFENEYRSGRSVVAVMADGNVQDATSIMARDGGYGIDKRFQQTTDYDTNAATMRGTTTEGEQNLKLREEQLRVQKQPVETGEARLRKDVVAEEKTMDVPVTHEEVYLERRPASGEPSDTPIGESETYRIPVREEQVTVEKQPVVREEVAMGKRQVQETQRVSDTVRREEAHIERSGDVTIHGTDGEDVSDISDQNTP